MPTKKKKETKSSVSKAKVKWSAADEDKLIDELKVQKQLENRSESGWKPSVWTAAAKAIPIPRHGTAKDGDACKRKWQAVCLGCLPVLVSAN